MGILVFWRAFLFQTVDWSNRLPLISSVPNTSKDTSADWHFHRYQGCPTFWLWRCSLSRSTFHVPFAIQKSVCTHSWDVFILSPVCSVVFIHCVLLCRGTGNGNRLWFSISGIFLHTGSLLKALWLLLAWQQWELVTLILSLWLFFPLSLWSKLIKCQTRDEALAIARLLQQL